MNYEDGKKFLLTAGYVAQGSDESPCYSTEAEKIIDEHFYLFDKDDEQEIEIIRAYWERIEE